MKVILFGEKISMDCLIVMDDVLGIADNCKKFAEVLTVCRKYRYHFIYVFHIIMPENQIWKKILSQTNIFNIFPSTVPYKTIAKILQSSCRQTTKKFVPARSVWLNRVFCNLANTDEQHCLKIDCSGVSKTVLVDIELKLMIQKNRFAILINPLAMSYTMFSEVIG